MGLSAELVPPPAVTVDCDGPVGAAIGEAMLHHLGTPATGAAPGGARPVIVVVEPGEDALSGLADRIAAATKARGRRVWVVVTEAAAVPAVDDIVEAAVGVDAVVLVDHSHSATAGAALAAWTWLRHDAPSTALGTLRDSSGRVCRVATVTAQAPTEPPHDVTAAQPVSIDKVDQVLHGGVARASALGGEAVATLLGSSDVSEVVSGIETTIADSVKPAGADLIADVSDWGPGELRGLRDAAQSWAQRVTPDDAAVAAAAVSLSRTDAAIAQEEARTGFSGMFGRRKRLAALTQAREEAWNSWCDIVASQGDQLAQRHLAQQVAEALPPLISSADERWQRTVADRSAAAMNRWLSTTVTAASQLQPPAPTADGKVSRTWGDARPEVRHHLLVPAQAAASLEGPLDTPVMVHGADGLPRPLAVAWLLGLSASSFTPAQSRG